MLAAPLPWCPPPPPPGPHNPTRLLGFGLCFYSDLRVSTAASHAEPYMSTHTSNPTLTLCCYIGCPGAAPHPPSARTHHFAVVIGPLPGICCHACRQQEHRGWEAGQGQGQLGVAAGCWVPDMVLR